MEQDLIQPRTRTPTLIFWWLVGLVPLIGLFLNLVTPEGFDATQSEWRDFIARFGRLGVVVFVLLQALQVVVTPINHYVIGFLGGFLYGPVLGGALNYVGRVFGHLAAFFLARKYGRRAAERWVSEPSIRSYDRLVGDRGFVLFLIYFLPFFPDDEISYLVGLSQMRLRTYVTALLLGHVGGSWSLAYVGAGIDTYDWFFWLLVVLTIVGFPLIVLLLRKRQSAAGNAA